MTDKRMTPELRSYAQELNDALRSRYREDPEFRAEFNQYLLDEFGIHVMPDEPVRTLAQIGAGDPTRH